MFSVFYNCCIKPSNIENHPERISNIKPFIDKYNWKGIDFLTGIKDWKKFEKNNKEVALKILHINQNITVNVKIK